MGMCGRLEADIVFLCGDEMFLKAMLDGRMNYLPHLMMVGIYIRNAPKTRKASLTQPLKDERIHIQDLTEYPTSVLRSIPLESTVFCLPHGLARCVEKLLTGASCAAHPPSQ